MSNEIYPLEKYVEDGPERGFGVRASRARSVNQRLVPIFRALADDPEGWECVCGGINFGEAYAARLPRSHKSCNHFSLVPKRRTITVEIPVPDNVTSRTSHGWSGTTIEWDGDWQADEVEKAIRSAMEGK